MTTLAVYACQWRELRPITFGGNATTTPGNLSTVPEDQEPGDEEQAYGRRGRGRGRDGAGEYEMVGMKPEDDK
jgi:hypothetical protein